MEHVGPSNVEHIIPKSAKPELVCEWANLTLACPACNTKKGTYFNANCALVNPYVDDPNDHLRWIGPMIEGITQDRGRTTVTRLSLNRSELLFKRTQEIQRARDIIRQIVCHPGAIGEALKEDLRAMVQDDAEYAAAIRVQMELEDIS